MTQSVQNIDPRLPQLISDLQDDCLCHSDRNLLNELLKASSEARAYYHTVTDLHVRLDSYYSGGALVPDMADMTSRGIASQKHKTFLNQPLIWGGAIAAILVLGLFVNALLLRSNHIKLTAANLSEQEAVSNEVEGVAVLTKSVELEWGDSLPHAYGEGDALPRGNLSLLKGIVQIEFFGGATVIIEAPSEFELISAVRARIKSGKLRAFVPEPAQGFVIEGPDFDTVDLGTEFAMSVGPSGQEVHVVEGEVSLHEKDGGLIQHLTDGLGVRALSGGELESVPNGGVTFVGRERISEMVARNGKDVVTVWAQSRERWLKDPDTLVYFDFEDHDPWDRRLKSAKLGAPEGAVVGAQWGQGRWPDKGALEFKSINDRVRLMVPGEYESITFSIHARIDALPNWSSGLFLTDDFEFGEPHWQIAQSGIIKFGIREIGRVSSEKVIDPELFGRWLHLVAVYDSEAQQMSLYLDGKLVGASPTTKRLPIRMGGAELGNWRSSKERSNMIRSLVGIVDEFLILKRALTKEEVRALYRQQVAKKSGSQ